MSQYVSPSLFSASASPVLSLGTAHKYDEITMRTLRYTRTLSREIFKVRHEVELKCENLKTRNSSNRMAPYVVITHYFTYRLRRRRIRHCSKASTA